MDFTHLILTISCAVLVVLIVKTVITIKKLRAAMKAASFDPAHVIRKAARF
ncbi:hypothetical protein [Buttiauxella gaviniae]|uniref:hypothetical protein n=1 Tax=Buttiauxella gaviniae TaxID=82990 RepID=UPI003C72B3FB